MSENPFPRLVRLTVTEEVAHHESPPLLPNETYEGVIYGVDGPYLFFSEDLDAYYEIPRRLAQVVEIK